MRNNGNGSDDDMPLDEPSPTRTPGRRRNRGLLAGALEEDDDNSAKEKSARATMADFAAQAQKAAVADDRAYLGLLVRIIAAATREFVVQESAHALTQHAIVILEPAHLYHVAVGTSPVGAERTR